MCVPRDYVRPTELINKTSLLIEEEQQPTKQKQEQETRTQKSIQLLQQLASKEPQESI